MNERSGCKKGHSYYRRGRRGIGRERLKRGFEDLSPLLWAENPDKRTMAVGIATLPIGRRTDFECLLWTSLTVQYSTVDLEVEISRGEGYYGLLQYGRE